jgi:hypothetical protein
VIPIDGLGGQTSQALCRSCGLCCDGTLFARVHIQPGDVEPPLVAGGIRIQTSGARRYFEQPCPAYRDACCQVYADRPANCRKYRCKLLRKYEDGTITWADAQQTIQRARTLRDAAGAEAARVVPDGNRMPLVALLPLVPAPSALAAERDLRTAWAPAMLWLSALLDCLHTHFQRPPQAEPAPPASPQISSSSC